MEQVDPVKLQQVIAEHFSDDELRQLCFELGWRWQPAASRI
jgi:hypothetical protein